VSKIVKSALDASLGFRGLPRTLDFPDRFARVDGLRMGLALVSRESVVFGREYKVLRLPVWKVRSPRLQGRLCDLVDSNIAVLSSDRASTQSFLDGVSLDQVVDGKDPWSARE
jgi:hypothetical protein